MPSVFDADYFRQSISLWTAAEKAAHDDPDASFCASLAKYPNLVGLLLLEAAKTPTYSVTAHPERFARPDDMDELLSEERRIREAASARGLPLKRSLQRGQDAWVLRRMEGMRRPRAVKASSVALVGPEDLIVRDGDCSGGEWNERRGYHARRLPDGSIEVYPRDGLDAVRFLVTDLAFDEGVPLRVAVRVRLPETGGRSGEAFRVRAKRGSKVVFERSVKTDELSTEDCWISAGDYAPALGDKLDIVGAVAGAVTVRVSAIRFERDAGN